MASAASPLGRSLPSSELDELTVARAKRGNASAWRALVQCYEGRVFALVSRMLAGVRPPTLVQDLAQETFIRVLRALPEFQLDGSARLSTWILCVASRLAVDELRRAPQHPSLDVERITAEGRTDHDLERKELGQALVAALSALQPSYRAVFVLREYHGLEYSEIARALDLQPANVATRLHRARVALRKALTEAGWNV